MPNNTVGTINNMAGGMINNMAAGTINSMAAGTINSMAAGAATGAINDKEPLGMIATKPAARAELGAIIETAAAGAQTGPITAKAVARAIIEGNTVDGIRAYELCGTIIFAANKTGYAVSRWSDVVQTDHPMYSIFIVRRIRLTVYTSGFRIIKIAILDSCTDTVE